MENSIPTDLIDDIFSRLPAESIARCCCVSKLWRSILRRQDFTELFLTSSSARPRLLLGVHHQDGEWSFYSTPQLQNQYQKSPLVVAADNHIKFSIGICKYRCTYDSGLIYFHNMCIPREDEDAKRVIYNPLTGQYVILPELRGRSYSSYLGFDPIDKEFKVLLMTTRPFVASNDIDHHILTLRTGQLRWRKIQCPFTHAPVWNRICINGVLYYTAIHSDGLSYVVVCFDVRSERFKFIKAECCYDPLINYKGNLCGIDLEYAYDGGFPIKLSMWVLEDVEKQEWSKYVYSLRDESKLVKVDNNLSVSGMTATGDIVLSMRDASKPFYVFYFNPERNTLQIVEMQGVVANSDCRVYAFVDYVEDLSVNDAMQLKSSPLQQDRNVVTKRPKPQQLQHTSPDLSKSSQSVKNEQNRAKPQQRRHTSRNLSKSSQSVKNKEQNKYELLADLLYHLVGLAILFFVSFSFFFVFFSSIILLA